MRFTDPLNTAAWRATLPRLAALAVALILTTAPATAGEIGDDGKGYLGITMAQLTPSLRTALDLKGDNGILVNEVLEDSPAEAAGIKDGDIVVEYDGTAIDSPRQLRKLVGRTKPGEKVLLRVIRKGRTRKLNATIGESPRERRIFSFGSGRFPRGFAFDFDFDDHGDAKFIFISRGQLGVEVTSLSSDLAAYFNVKAEEGLLVLDVWDKSVAATAGLKAGDIILKVNTAKISSVDELREVLRDLEDGDDFTLSIVRQGKPLNLTARMKVVERGRRFSSGLELYNLRLPGMHWMQYPDDGLLDDMDDLEDKLQDIGDQLSRLRGS